jgi:hypothetical protein
MLPIDLLRRIDSGLGRVVQTDDELKKMMQILGSVLDTDIVLRNISPFKPAHWFLDKNGQTLPLTDNEKVKMNQERTLINHGLCTVYHVLFAPEYGPLAEQTYVGRSQTILLHDQPYAITVRVCNFGPWVLDFNAGYYWTEMGGRRTLEYSVQQSEGSLEKFQTFKDMLCRLCILTGNERLVKRIERSVESIERSVESIERPVERVEEKLAATPGARVRRLKIRRRKDDG